MRTLELTDAECALIRHALDVVMRAQKTPFSFQLSEEAAAKARQELDETVALLEKFK